ncbi:MAG: hypothetical protein ACYTAF_17260 [Planctomycetota bacterium]
MQTPFAAVGPTPAATSAKPVELNSQERRKAERPALPPEPPTQRKGR